MYLGDFTETSSMQVIYAHEAFPKKLSKSIFLAGPTPRSNDVASWRPDVLSILEDLQYDGVVFSPEPKDGSWHREYEQQVEWEERALHMADCILFWVPREMVTMPALTTNVEFGMWCDTGKIVFGAPENAAHVRYLQHYTVKECVPEFKTLKETVQAAVNFIGVGAERIGGECAVPMHIWTTQSFQSWYKAMCNAGNRLDDARVRWVFRIGKNKSILFAWVLHVDVYITSEDRHKTNEFVFARPDISTVVLYHKKENLLDTDIVLIREFRSPVSNSSGFVWEVPGGSSSKPGMDPLALAAAECNEETGLSIAPNRLRSHGARQIVATLSAHKGHVFSAELTKEEVEKLRNCAGVPYGIIEDTERTYTEVVRLGDLLKDDRVDWSMLGMIFAVVQG